MAGFVAKRPYLPTLRVPFRWMTASAGKGGVAGGAMLPGSREGREPLKHGVRFAGRICLRHATHFAGIGRTVTRFASLGRRGRS
jgi:hypothetical protein